MLLPNTLGLDDDLDGVEVVRNLEASFGVKFSNKEAEDCRTVSDIFVLLQERFVPDEPSGRGCASAMAFYRLRRTFEEAGVHPRVTPKTVLQEVAVPSPKAVFRKFHLDTKLRLPRLPFSRTGQIGLSLLFMGIGQVGLAVILLGVLSLSRGEGGMYIWMAASIVVVVGGSLLMLLDEGRFPASCHSVGDLACKVAGLNFGVFLSAGAANRERDIWRALTEVLSEHSFLPRLQIRRDTLLLQSQLPPARGSLARLFRKS